jgi:hypothetical protein
MRTTTTTRTGCICGTCGQAHVGHFDPFDCSGCGVSFVKGAPAALIEIATGYVPNGVSVEPTIHFVGRWLPERRRQIEDALAPKREPLRLVKAADR